MAKSSPHRPGIKLLLRLNWQLNRSNEHLWLALRIPVIGLICTLCTAIKLELGYVALAAITFLPLVRLLNFNYEFNFQHTATYRMLPASQIDKFLCQLIYSWGIGMVYALLILGTYLLSGYVLHLVNAEYQTLTYDMIQLYVEQIAHYLSLTFATPHQWYLPLTAYLLMHGVLIWLCCAWGRHVLVLGLIGLNYIWLPLGRTLKGLPGAQPFVNEHPMVAGMLLALLTLFVFQQAYRSFCRSRLRTAIVKY